jgi:hypothetical protein
VVATENERTERHVNLIDHARPEQTFVEFSAAFTEQAFHAPLLAQPAARGSEVDFFPSTNFDRIGDGTVILKNKVKE